jgi:hypothetical protein
MLDVIVNLETIKIVSATDSGELIIVRVRFVAVYLLLERMSSRAGKIAEERRYRSYLRR